jgi:hypothetical protein
MATYESRLKQLELQAVEADQGASPVTTSEIGNHCLSMIPKMRKFIVEGRMDKFYLWLGFLQGLLWSQGFYTIEQLLAHNKE